MSVDIHVEQIQSLRLHAQHAAVVLELQSRERLSRQ
jgi:hypothetical protein